jgi:hypothetical protein
LTWGYILLYRIINIYKIIYANDIHDDLIKNNLEKMISIKAISYTSDFNKSDF